LFQIIYQLVLVKKDKVVLEQINRNINRNKMGMLISLKIRNKVV
jgi:hypothetical protein